ncbi:hypothetical protein GY45DRAFT_1376131 [Cubamyces sp. BRFM 1775]|nr:hypothetical protein GY45DRAFT_1376131 [Cubamyces sp. BRFM 1775]
MEEVRGLGRGSYIWGRSVHNIRIERLWVDVTMGFGQKWKDFFHQLEQSYGLNIDNDAHIWLLHHLFLDALNRDAMRWAEAWNNHVLARRGEHHMTPHQMYLFGLAQHGQRGIRVAQDAEEPVRMADEDFAEYGVDWDEIEHPAIRDHHDRYNLDDGDNINPFMSNNPTHLSHVEVPDSRCPIRPEQVIELDAQLAQLPSYSCHNMHTCLELWIAALDIARAI